MFIHNPYDHTPFLKKELNQLLTEGSFASRVWKGIGYELHEWLSRDTPDGDETFSSLFSSQALFLWINRYGALDIESFVNADGYYEDDYGREIPVSVERSLTGTEQMAAYGLWLVTSFLHCLGEIPDVETEFNENGFRRHEVLEHKAECMLLAYQALFYAHRLLDSPDLNEDEQALASSIDFSSLGKKGAEKRHAPMRELERYAVELYRQKQWKSANQAAYQLKDLIIAHGRSIGAVLSEENAQRTIAGWFRKCLLSG